MFVVYKIVNNIDGKIYIGQTVQDLHKRWIQHKSDAKSRSYHSVLHRAMNKFGIQNFTISVVSRCYSMKEMNYRESYYIKLFNCLAPNGYNVSLGGDGHRHSEETKRKMSAAKMGKKTGKTWNKGLSASESTKAKLKITQKGENNGMFGRKHSEHTRAKIGLTRIGKSNPGVIENLAKINSKPIICHENGMIFASCVETAKYFNISPQSVVQVAKRQRKQCKGFTFSYHRPSEQ